MKNKADAAPLNNYSFKFFAALITFAGFLVFSWLKFSGKVLPVGEYDYKTQLQTSLWIFALGLFWMAFSKEKIDDERVQQVRATAMRLCFQLLVTYLLIFNLKNLLENGIGLHYTLELVIGCLLVYHLVFYASLYFNLNLSATDREVPENLRIRPKFYLIFMLVQVIGLGLLYLLH